MVILMTKTIVLWKNSGYCIPPMKNVTNILLALCLISNIVQIFPHTLVLSPHVFLLPEQSSNVNIADSSIIHKIQKLIQHLFPIDRKISNTLVD